MDKYEMKNRYDELTEIERNRVNAYYNACCRREIGFASAQSDIDFWVRFLRGIDYVAICAEIAKGDKKFWEEVKRRNAN